MAQGPLQRQGEVRSSSKSSDLRDEDEDAVASEQLIPSFIFRDFVFCFAALFDIESNDASSSAVLRLLGLLGPAAFSDSALLILCAAFVSARPRSRRSLSPSFRSLRIRIPSAHRSQLHWIGTYLFPTHLHAHTSASFAKYLTSFKLIIIAFR